MVLLFRIIEIEWAVKNGKPFNPSPKKARKKATKKTKKSSSMSSKGSHASTGEVLPSGPEAEIEQENVGVPLKLSQKRHASEDADSFATPLKKTKLYATAAMDEN